MTLQEKQEGYLQELGSLEDEFDQYTWLMQLACQRPELCQVAHQEERRFLGCQSNLWVELGCQEGRLSLSVDSDTLIVKGLAVMLADIVTGCTPQEVAQGDISLYQKLGLEVALTSVRRSGFAHLVGWVQRRAGELAQETP